MKKLAFIMALAGVLALGVLPALATTPRALEEIDAFDLSLISDAQAQDIRGTFPFDFMFWLLDGYGVMGYLTDPSGVAEAYYNHIMAEGGHTYFESLGRHMPDFIYLPLFCGKGG